MAKRYDQYCPIAQALDLVGERWSLLIVRELLEHGPLRYSDLHANLEHCGTNILATRLKDLERGNVVQRRRLPPPAASTVYELTEFGAALRPVLHQLAHWGARLLEPPTDAVLEPGWLRGALQLAVPPNVGGRVEFRVGGEIASVVEGQVVDGPIEAPDAVVTGDPVGLFRFFVDRELAVVDLEGSRAALEEILAALPHPAPTPRAVQPA